MGNLNRNKKNWNKKGPETSNWNKKDRKQETGIRRTGNKELE